MRALFLLCLFIASCCSAQIYDANNVTVQTFAGSAFYGLVDGQGAQTMFNNPKLIVADTSSNLFVLDQNGQAIRKITPSAVVTTFDNSGFLQGYGNKDSMLMDSTGNIWFATDYSTALVFINSTNSIWGGYQIRNYLNLSSTYGLCIDNQNRKFFSDYVANKIYLFDTNGTVSVFVGSGNTGGIDGNGIFTSFSSPSAMVMDPAGNLYVWDAGNYSIRKITPGRDVTTIAGYKPQYYPTDSDGPGTSASISSVSSMCMDGSGNIILACGKCLRRLSPQGNLTTIAGSFTESGYVNGSGQMARFGSIGGVCCVGGALFVSDSGNYRIRKITFGQPAPPQQAELSLDTYAGIKINGALGGTYQVQSSPDMAAWTNRASVYLNSTPYLWVDQSPVAGNKYYRAVLMR